MSTRGVLRVAKNIMWTRTASRKQSVVATRQSSRLYFVGWLGASLSYVTVVPRAFSTESWKLTVRPVCSTPIMARSFPLNMLQYVIELNFQI